MVSSFPPTACGIATFSAALSRAMTADGSRVQIVRAGPAPPTEDPMVVGSLSGSSDRDVREAADRLNRCDVVVVQHEYGLYAGPDGDQIVDLLRQLTVPAVVVAHTVLRTPTPGQQTVLEQVCTAAAAVVTMTEAGATQLTTGFDVDPTKVSIIPHGAAVALPATASGTADAPTLLTWGLLGPGKGIEWAIDALAMLADLHPRPGYLIAGATHPKVRARSGEAYRRMLVERAQRAGVEDQVVFDDAYRGVEDLTGLIGSADLVVLPYDDDQQVTSGVLVDAVAAGRPVVSTAFPHAVELLGSGTGLIVPQRDAGALAGAIRTVLTEPGRAAAMAAEARRLAPGLSWGAVAQRYHQLADRLVAGQCVAS